MHQYYLLCARIAAVFYDLDGTLANTEEILFETWVEKLAEHGCVFTAQDYMGIIGTPEDEKVPELLARFGIKEDPKLFYARFTARLKERMSADLQPMPGAEESLRNSHTVCKQIGLVTSATDWHATFALEKLGFKHYFQPSGRVTAETVGLARRKPFPDPYALAARQLHVLPSACVAFEDSVHGAQAAFDAGMFVVGVPHRFSPREKLAAIAHHVIPEGKTIGDFRFSDIKDIEILLPKGSR